MHWLLLTTLAASGCASPSPVRGDPSPPVARAHTPAFGAYELGEFYPARSRAEPAVAQVAEAVVSFGNATGTIVSPDGLVLTNHHVFERHGASPTVRRRHEDTSRPGETLQLSLVAVDAPHDLALYRASAGRPLPYVRIRERPPRTGEPVFILGHPHGAALRASFGTVLTPAVVVDGIDSVEYSAQTWWGSSGSPVCDVQGRLIALHWGWDAEGRSEGRLTGVPVSAIAQVFPMLRPRIGAD